MTAAFKKGFLRAKPAEIADGIDRAVMAGSPMVYLPWFWRYIMLVIRSIPEWLFVSVRL